MSENLIKTTNYKKLAKHYQYGSTRVGSEVAMSLPKNCGRTSLEIFILINSLYIIDIQ